LSVAPPKEDSWLSGFLGKPVFHLKGDFSDQATLDLPSGSAFVDCKVDVSDLSLIEKVSRMGFLLIDTNVQLTLVVDKGLPDTTGSRLAVGADADGVRHVAKTSFTKSRFHLDPAIDQVAADAIKESWAGNFFKGQRGDWMVVAESDGEIAGFNQLLRKGDDEVIIDLIGVSEAHRSKGLAKSMILFAAKECLSEGGRVIVGTQISNFPSLALYNKLGFRVSSAQYVFHLHK